MVCSCVLYYDLLYQTISIFFVRTVLAYCSCVLFLRTVLAHCCYHYSTSLSVVYGGPEWTLIIKLRNKHYFAGSFPANFVQNIS